MTRFKIFTGSVFNAVIHFIVAGILFAACILDRPHMIMPFQILRFTVTSLLIAGLLFYTVVGLYFSHPDLPKLETEAKIRNSSKSEDFDAK